MDPKTINLAKEIVYFDGTTTRRNIGRVVYSDPHNTLHTIWPTNATLTDVYVVELHHDSEGRGAYDIPYKYYYDTSTQEPYYIECNSIGEELNNTHLLLLPNKDYAVRGTIVIKDDNQNVVHTLRNCYFWGETVGSHNAGEDGSNWVPFSSNIEEHSSNVTYHYGNRYAIDENNNTIGYGQSSPPVYAAWYYPTDGIGNGGDISLQLGFSDFESFYSQNGFLFDVNYTSPLIFKRCEIRQTMILNDYDGTSGSNIINPSNGIYLTVGDTIKIYPKFKKFSPDNSEYEVNNITPTIVTYNQDHTGLTEGKYMYDTQYLQCGTISTGNDNYGDYLLLTATATSNGWDENGTLDFYYNAGRYVTLEELQVFVNPTIEWISQLYDDSNNTYNLSTSSTFELSGSLKVRVKYRAYNSSDSYTNANPTSVVSSNSSVISVRNNNGVFTLDRHASGNAVISITYNVDGVPITKTYNMSVTMTPVYMQIDGLSGYTTPTLIVPNDEEEDPAQSISISQNTDYTVRFFADINGTSPKKVQLDFDESDITWTGTDMDTNGASVYTITLTNSITGSYVDMFIEDSGFSNRYGTVRITQS